MRAEYIYSQVGRLVRRYHTRNPLMLLSCLNVVVGHTDRYEKLKGYCFSSCRTYYVMISSRISDEEQRIVAAHELGHVLLHKAQLRMAPMRDSLIYNMTDQTEYEANLFAADLLIPDESVEELASDPDAGYFDMCSALYVTPDLMSFKLFSLTQRGHSYSLPQEPDSRFLSRPGRDSSS